MSLPRATELKPCLPQVPREETLRLRQRWRLIQHRITPTGEALRVRRELQRERGADPPAGNPPAGERPCGCPSAGRAGLGRPAEAGRPPSSAAGWHRRHPDLRGRHFRSPSEPKAPPAIGRRRLHVTHTPPPPPTPGSAAAGGAGRRYGAPVRGEPGGSPPPPRRGWESPPPSSPPARRRR